jgi:acetyl/propionyl-CoA carboxylase alpha subunit
MFRSMKQLGTVARHFTTTALYPQQNSDLVRALQAATQHYQQLKTSTPGFSLPGRLRDPQDADDFQAHLKEIEITRKNVFDCEYQLLSDERRRLKWIEQQPGLPKRVLEKPLEKLLQEWVQVAPSNSTDILEKYKYWAAQSILNRYHHLVLVHTRGLTAMDIIAAAKARGMRPIMTYLATDAETPAVLSVDPEDRILIKDYGSLEELETVILKIKEDRGQAPAVHLGIGYLSESSHAAALCKKLGALSIGPNEECLRTCGDKGKAKYFAESLNLAVPKTYYTTSSDTIEDMKQAAKKISYPVMVKNPFGGGGKNNRLAENEEALVNAVQSLSPKGQHKLIFEKYIKGARHIEFQLLISKFGSLYLGARDCSLQKFFQKLFEKLLADAKLLKKSYPIAMQIGEALHAMGYRGACTVEFLVDENDNFYFMEMNPRKQMERRVTEAVTKTWIAPMVLDAVINRITDPQEFTDLQHRLKDIALSPNECIRHVRLNAHNVGYNDGKLYYEGISGKVTRLVTPSNTDDGEIKLAIQENTRLGHKEEAIDTQFGYVLTRGKTQKEADEKAIQLVKQIKIEVDGVEQPCNFEFARFCLQYLVDHPEQKELINTGDFLGEQYIAHCEQQATLQAEAEQRPRF